jgi:cyclopropane fatty-acyl-phospholipid synthase-like methyltransferase
MNILDIGCGMGQLLTALQREGFLHLRGIDINEESIAACKKNGLAVEKVNDIREFAARSAIKYDRIIMSHVLEHIDKDLIIDTLAHIKKYLLQDSGTFLLMVPNAQSHTGAYWRYEDFTHTIMFTSGSCSYVLKAAGFSQIEFIDPDGTRFMNPLKKMLVKPLIAYFKFRENFWNKVMQTSYHRPSPRIYTFDLKVSAS